MSNKDHNSSVINNKNNKVKTLLPSSKKLDYERYKKKKYVDNLNIFLKNYNNKNNQYKIKQHCDKFKISIDDVNNRIKNGDIIVASMFTKDPSKQNFYENTAANFIKNIKNVKNFENLPGSGENTTFLYKNKILTKDEKENLNLKRSIKSIDFKWNYGKNNIEYFAFHKYIKDNGGAQDNQYNEVLNSIILGSIKNTNGKTNHKVLFICDGKYFTIERMDRLKKNIVNVNQKVLTMNEIENYLMKNQKVKKKKTKTFSK